MLTCARKGDKQVNAAAAYNAVLVKSDRFISHLSFVICHLPFAIPAERDFLTAGVGMRTPISNEK
jgi:hypothetical protein